MKYLLLLILTITLSSCVAKSDPSQGPKGETSEYDSVNLSGIGEGMKTVRYEGHEYILYKTTQGSSITHKENCRPTY